MSKINFRKIIIKNIKDDDMPIDLHETLGNQLYMKGANIVQCELGKKIFFADGEIDVTEEEISAIKACMSDYPYIIREAVINILS